MLSVSRRSLCWLSAFAAVPLFKGTDALAESINGSPEVGAAGFRADADLIIPWIERNYAYSDRLPGGKYPHSAQLEAARSEVRDRASLIAYAEQAIMALADHHAITGSALSDSWALAPSYADLWVELVEDHYEITAVRAKSPAEQAGIVPGYRLEAFRDMPFDQAVEAFWQKVGGPLTDSRRSHAARVLAAGRRDRLRDLTLISPNGQDRRLQLASLYSQPVPQPSDAITIQAEGSALKITINDSLGDIATIDAFDAALVGRRHPEQPVIIDLTETPSGGNTTVARAIMGWFVREPRPYQIHELTSEYNEYGVRRRWIEQVLPRDGKSHKGPVTVRVGRWTGSMGEGLAIGFDALGAKIEGNRMAGLLGAIYDYRLPSSGLVIKIPAERLSHINGTPREAFLPMTLAA